MYSICKYIFDIIENNVIKCVFLNKTYLSRSQFVFSQCISHLLLRNASRSTRAWGACSIASKKLRHSSGNINEYIVLI